MNGESRRSPVRHSYEFGSATIIVFSHSGTILDGLIKVKFSCHIHPADGSDVRVVPVWTFYPFLAANSALKAYEKQRNNEKKF